MSGSPTCASRQTFGIVGRRFSFHARDGAWSVGYSIIRPLRPARGDLPEWKRIEREWERVIPSTSLAGRIQALLRVLEKPERWVERTARRLKPDLVERLRSAPLPHYRKPKLDRSPYGFLSQPLAHSHVLLDTS